MLTTLTMKDKIKIHTFDVLFVSFFVSEQVFAEFLICTEPSVKKAYAINCLFHDEKIGKGKKYATLFEQARSSVVKGDPNPPPTQLTHYFVLFFILY